MLNARPFAVNGIAEPKAAYAPKLFWILGGRSAFYSRNSFDFSKVFWFVNYNGTRLRNGIDSALNEPTLLQRSGDFSQTSERHLRSLDRFAFPRQRIPQSRISPIAQSLLTYLPLPNQNIAGVNQNYRFIASNPNNPWNLNTRINTTLTPTDTLALTLNVQKRQAETFETFGCCDIVNGQGINTNLNWRRRFGNRSFNNVTLSFNRNTNTTVPFFANGPDIAAQLGIQGASPSPLDYGPPNLSFTNFAGLSDTNFSKSAIWNYGVSDMLQLHRGKNNWSFGGGYTHYLNNTITDSNGRGAFNFSELATAGYGPDGLPIA